MKAGADTRLNCFGARSNPTAKQNAVGRPLADELRYRDDSHPEGMEGLPACRQVYSK